MCIMGWPSSASPGGQPCSPRPCSASGTFPGFPHPPARPVEVWINPPTILGRSRAASRAGYAKGPSWASRRAGSSALRLPASVARTPGLGLHLALPADARCRSDFGGPPARPLAQAPILLRLSKLISTAEANLVDMRQVYLIIHLHHSPPSPLTVGTFFGRRRDAG